MDKKMKIGFGLMMFLQLITFCLYVETSQRLKKDQELRDARGSIQNVALEAHFKNCDFNDIDVQKIRDNWKAAEYERVLDLNKLLSSKCEHRR